MHHHWTGLLGLGAALGLGCLEPTPFGVDVDTTGVTRASLAALAARPVEGPFAFAALGDTHDAYEELASAVAAIRARDVELVAHTGDLTDLGLEGEYAIAERILQALGLPHLVAIGNHDALSNGKLVYARMFGPRDFSFVHGSVKFVFFDSNALESPGEVPDFPWLTAEVSDRQGARLLVLVSHQPPTLPDDLPGDPNVQRLASLMGKHPVDLYVAGHMRDFRLFRYHGALVLQCGSFDVVPLFTIVKLDPAAGTVGFEQCLFDRCVTVSPEAP